MRLSRSLSFGGGALAVGGVLVALAGGTALAVVLAFAFLLALRIYVGPLAGVTLRERLDLVVLTGGAAFCIVAFGLVSRTLGF